MTSQVFTDSVTLTAASWFNDADSSVYSYLTGLAGQNSLTATGPASMTAYAAGQMFRFTPVSTNSVSTTLAVTANSVALGVKNIFSNGAACVGGEIVAGVPTAVIYDGTQFNISAHFAPRFKVSSFTRNLTTASGTQAMTGVGFKPKALAFLSVVDSAIRASWGFDDGTVHVGIFDNYNDIVNTWGAMLSTSIQLNSGGGNTYTGAVTSLDADGFTVTWAKAGAPTGTTTVLYLALR